MAVSESVEDLILLVGHNPMPNFIVACMLQPKRIYWVYTKNGTSQEQRRLKNALTRRFPSMIHEECVLDDAADPQGIRRAIQAVPEGAWLNYTGGTKVMTVQTYRYWWENRGGIESRASYLDGRNGLLRFDNGDSMKIPDLSLRIDEILDLHGLTRDPKKSRHPEAGIRDEDAGRLLAAILEDPSRSSLLYRTCKPLKDTPKEVVEPIDLSFLPENSRPEFTRRAEWPTRVPKGLVETWGDYLTGGWFEDWVFRVAERLNERHRMGLQIASEVRPNNAGKQSELDIVVLRNYRVYLISCTTETNSKSIVKSKCYEARNRAELIGGGLAKAAVVCLLKPGSAAELERLVGIPWQDEQSQVKVFDRGHVRAWFEDDDYTALTNWLAG